MARGMWVEGEGHGFAPGRPRDTQSFLQQCPVAEVHTVEISDGHGWAAQGSTQVSYNAAAALNGIHSFRDTGRRRLRQISSFSTSCSLSLQIAPMTKVWKGRDWPMLDPAMFAGALLLYALVMPLGLAHVESASQVAAGIALDTSTQPAFFALLAMRVGQFLPLGDAALRANLVSALLCALAIALVGRLCLQVCALLRPPSNARQEARDFAHEPVAATGAALAMAFSLSSFDLGTSAGSGAATLVLLTLALLPGFALLRDSNCAVAGYVLAGMAGLSAGVDLVAGPLLWPPMVGLAIWSLRKGARWPLLAPLCFVAAWGTSALACVASASAPINPSQMLSSVAQLGMHGGDLWSSAVELADEVGVVGSLVAAIGMVVLATRAAVLTAWLALTALTSLLFAHSVAHASALWAPTRAALPLAIAVTCVFACAGLLHMSSRLGRARVAATFALAAMIVLSPAMDSGRSRRRTPVPMHLLDRALSRVEVGALVCPGTPEMDGLFRLARAQGLRPDLEIDRGCANAK
jgi:hypothetical protein